MQIEFFGATREVTGSCYLLRVGDYKILVECGLIQGSYEHERHNDDPFHFNPRNIDAVVLTHAHLDHSGRLPLLIKRGYRGKIYTHRATSDLCRIMLEDSGYLNEKDALWENKRRKRKGKELVEPLYTRKEARLAGRHFHSVEYGKRIQVLPGIHLTLRDAGHILGSAIAELELDDGSKKRKVVFSGDLGHRGAPIIRNPEIVKQADLVVMESTYGDRCHRSWDETWKEMGEIISQARSNKSNILIPAFTVGRTQEILYMFKRYYQDWGIGDWEVFLDSPMGIEATEVYARHAKVYDAAARQIYETDGDPFDLPNLHLTEHTDESARINKIKSGAIIIAGSGMCTGGRIKRHFEHNIARPHTHILIVGFQARGTLGRALVDGVETIHLWGKEYPVRAHIHTIGGLSAHADQRGLLDWYGHFKGRPPVVLVHGEPEAMDILADKLEEEYQAPVTKAEFKQIIQL
ncbi:MBL fold metallo-hydrolase RNA specificity domain-containing protein [Emcibacter nanhaiensis]|uniref:MBL fold metallo-hydrolase n=1 Tax=Emcibacter nanhaiensis TaxID=1505037 RepID=A0A501PBR5_9PROT|nr:MBL fold metallo-hydrolase [Emcibacter nanhaiensis]TPD57800.1 MBL fold metallo-hydrolase [Emcibacter nanhaiensis]